jgi:hypothetical protein
MGPPAGRSGGRANDYFDRDPDRLPLAGLPPDRDEPDRLDVDRDDFARPDVEREPERDEPELADERERDDDGRERDELERDAPERDELERELDRAVVLREPLDRPFEELRDLVDEPRELLARRVLLERRDAERPSRRSAAGISSRATAFASCGICFSRNLAIRSSSRRMPRASFAVSPSPTLSASASIPA